jgi:alginate O-acetyltransferase complex protein AlgI
MLFNSIDFIIFFPLVFLIFWIIPKDKNQARNAWILVSSYVFYGWWDPRFLALVAFSSILDFLIANAIEKTNINSRKKILLFISICFNLGLLGFFKYYNFFLENFQESFRFFGSEISTRGLDIVLPVGISFYTFQTMSYTIDVYRGQMKADNSLLNFFAYVSFFPQLVAGPIERGSNLLPQFRTDKVFNYGEAVMGSRQVLWGFFKKIVIADNCAVYANQIFDNYEIYSGSTLLLGAVFFAFQIYGDFSGYSDIAIGISRILGFRLMQNFAFPYFSRDMAEFWRRWHISLSTWFRDYLYIPLGGSKGGKIMQLRNTMIIFLVSGFWHGANWTFLVWGALNALYFIPLLLTQRNRKNLDIIAENSMYPDLLSFLSMSGTFLLTIIAWVFFRSPDVRSAWAYLIKIPHISLFQLPEVIPFPVFLLLGIFVIIEWLGRRGSFALEKLDSLKKPTRYALYYVILFLMFWFGNQEQDFIYFQF